MKITVLRSVAALTIPLLGMVSCQTSQDRQLIQERRAALYQEFRSPMSTSEKAARRDEAILYDRANLQVYLDFGLQRNAGLRGEFERWQAGLSKVAQVDSLPDPQFSFTQYIEEVQTRTGPQERRYGISQWFPWFGKLELRGDVAAKRAEALWQQVQSKRLQVERDIVVAYYEYAYLAQSIRITQGNLQLLQQLEPVVQGRLQGGGGQADLLRLQVEAGKLENQVESLRQIRPALSARLAAALNAKQGEVLPLPELQEPKLMAVEAATMLQHLAEQNPELLRLRQMIASEEKALELARLEAWPDFSLGLDYVETGSALAPATSGSGDDPYALRLMFTLPIWRGRYAAAERQAQHDLGAARYEHDERLADLRADVELAAYALGDAARQVALYRDSLLPRAREALQVTRASYRAGRAGVLELMDSERALLDFELSYWRACRDYLQGGARLKALTGEGLQ